MDAKRTVLEEKLQACLAQAATIATQLQALDQGRGTPHFDQIEMPAHEVGQQLSQMIQTTRAREVAAEGLEDQPCPQCGKPCAVETSGRQVHSIDGRIKLTETVAHCNRCRRAFSPQREALGFDPRESTPGFKRQVTILNSETRSFKRAAVVMQGVHGFEISANTIERIGLDVGNDLLEAQQKQWQDVLTGEVPVPDLAIVEFDGGRIRGRQKGTFYCFQQRSMSPFVSRVICSS